MKVIVFCFITMVANACFGIPRWAVNSYKKNGGIVEVVCIGIGPSLDHARLEATDNCLASVSREFVTTSNVKTFSMETLEETYLQHTVDTQTELKDIACSVLNEEFEKSNDQFTVYRKCQFDLSKVKVRQELPRNSEKSQTSIHSPVPTAVVTKVHGFVQAPKMITITSAPKCDFIKILPSEDIVVCTENPQIMKVPENAQAIEVNKSGHHPKKVKLNKDINNEDITLILERL